VIPIFFLGMAKARASVHAIKLNELNWLENCVRPGIVRNITESGNEITADQKSKLETLSFFTLTTCFIGYFINRSIPAVNEA
jgi:hypothetical protein